MLTHKAHVVLIFFWVKIKKKNKQKKKYFVLLEGPSQTLLWANCPPHFCIFFCCIRFVVCLSVVTVVLSFKWKKCMNNTYIKKRFFFFLFFVQFRNPHVSIHITLTSLTFKPSFVRGPNNPHTGLRPYLEKLKIRVETHYNM